MVLWWPTRPYRTNTKRDVLFIIGDWNANVGSQEIPGVPASLAWSTKWSRAKANRVLQREHTGHSKILFQQHKRWFYTWTSPEGQYRNPIDYILCSQRWRSSIQSAKTRPGNDCGSDHELLIAKFRLKLKKVGKTTRPFRYDLNKTPYDYTVKVTNRFKGLDLIDSLPEELWMEVHDIIQEVVIKIIPKKKKWKKTKWCLRRPYK